MPRAVMASKVTPSRAVKGGGATEGGAASGVAGGAMQAAAAPAVSRPRRNSVQAIVAQIDSTVQAQIESFRGRLLWQSRRTLINPTSAFIVPRKYQERYQRSVGSHGV